MPAGDCLNLREQPSRSAKSVTCLPGGSRVTAVRVPVPMVAGMPPPGPGAVQAEGDWWVHVETGQSEDGWMAVAAGNIAWAPPQPCAMPGPPTTPQPPASPGPPTRVDVMAGEAQNMTFWIHIAATGEDPCADSPRGCIADMNFSSVTDVLIMRCRRASPGKYRTAPGYDPARHEPPIGPFAEACNILEVAESTLGRPADTPEWRQQARESEAALSRITFP